VIYLPVAVTCYAIAQQRRLGSARLVRRVAGLFGDMECRRLRALRARPEVVVDLPREVTLYRPVTTKPGACRRAAGGQEAPATQPAVSKTSRPATSCSAVTQGAGSRAGRTPRDRAGAAGRSLAALVTNM